MKHLIICVCLTLFLTSCKNQTNTNEQKQTDTKRKTASENSTLRHYDFDNTNPDIIKLPAELNEISGICFNDKGQMFAHGDEDADVFEIDVKTGNISKTFFIADKNGNPMKGDFEDIACVGSKFFMVKNNGTLYEFTEGSDKQGVEAKEYKTNLNSENDVEGLCYDRSSNTLLLACKGFAGTGYERKKAIYSFDLVSLKLNETPRFLITTKDIRKDSKESEFEPSGITYNSKSGTFYVIAARGNLILEIDKDGNILDVKNLPEKFHTQPEGIALDKDFNLYISNEGKGGKAGIVSYPYIP